MAQARDEQGNIWDVTDPARPVLVQAAGAAPQMPADPTFPLQAPKVQAEISNATANAQGQQIDNRVAGATVGAQITSANAEATAKTRTAQTAGLPEGFMWDASGNKAVPIPGYTRQGLSPEIRSQAIQVLSDADALERTADELEKLYKAGPGSTHGIRGLQDYLPTDANKVFNDAGQQARGYVKRALGFTGGEGNTVAESSALYDPYLPKAGDRDAQIERKIQKLRELAGQARKKSSLTLGGVPDANGNIQPLPNAMTMQRVTSGGDPLQAAAFGATQGITEQYPPEMVQAHEALVGRLIMQGGGRIDPQAYAAERAKLNQQFGFSGDPQADIGWANGINDYLSKGGKTVPGDITPPERDLSATEQFRNNLVNNPVGAGAANFADMGGMGVVSLAFPDQMAALNEDHPLASTLGQVGGSIGGATGLGKLVGAGAGKIAPQLLGGGAKAALARNIGTDALYSGITGAAQGQDPLTAAAWGAAGSAGGNAVGKIAGKAVGGINTSAPVQYLRSRGIPLTVGQTLGGFAKSAEDAATSVPGIGDLIGRRYKDSLRGLSRAAGEDVGAPIGHTPRVDATGKPLLDDLGGAVSDYYTNTVAGANAPLDGQYAQDFAGVVGLGQTMPPDLQFQLGKALDNSTAPINNAGAMTGEAYQKAMMRLKNYKGQHKGGGFEADYRDALSGAQDALKGQMQRGGGQHVVEGINKADQSYRMLKTLDRAVNKADGAGYLPTASQLQDAIQATGKKFPGRNPLSTLADNAQEVLPSRLPDSGTGRRLAQYGLGLTALGGAQASDTYGGTDILNPQSIGLLALLAAGGTKAGQKALVAGLVDRPQAATKVGKALGRRSGLFGRAMLPFALADQ